ncbi:hypothetical protein TNCV_2878651 [Trichonephila clavipes]|uniref:Uncharacterized protein n=1 Tax=Trichonephila clavipes TaxID=2585209 RepID=A0A8X7BC72_TRICX|nr:hypothetical protein TNCV_2878651 [Trichonephila clavipes]
MRSASVRPHGGSLVVPGLETLHLSRSKTFRYDHAPHVGSDVARFPKARVQKQNEGPILLRYKEESTNARACYLIARSTLEETGRDSQNIEILGFYNTLNRDFLRTAASIRTCFRKYNIG